MSSSAGRRAPASRRGVSAFDESADSYDAWYRTPVGQLTDRLEKDAVFALIEGAGGYALDLSCGTGNYAHELHRRGWRVIGVDRSLAMVRVAERTSAGVHGAPSFICGDAAALPLRSGCMDLVLLILGLEFMADPDRALGEVRRVLAPSAHAVVAILPAWGAWNVWRRLKRTVSRSIWREARFISERALNEALARHALIAVARRRAVHYLPVLRWILGLRVWESIARRVAPGLASFIAVRCEVDPSRR